LIEHGFTSAPTQYRLYGRRDIYLHFHLLVVRKMLIITLYDKW